MAMPIIGLRRAALIIAALEVDPMARVDGYLT
jgi:hypothetical protein